MRTHPRKAALVALMALAPALALAPLAGCRGDRSNKPPRRFFPDMDHQEKYKPQTESRFFADYTDEETGERYGRSQREPVPGTVAFGRAPYVQPVMGVDFSDRAEFLREDDAWSEGRVYRFRADGASVLDENDQRTFEWVEYMPVETDRDLTDLGHKMYDIFCLPCHGGTGQGDGLVGSRWSYVLPNFHDDIYQPGADKGQDGYLFHIIRNGVANVGGAYPLKMPGYARKLTIEETWAIVAHIRSLQATRRGELSDLTETERLELERRRTGVATPATPGNTQTDEGGAQ